MSYNIEKIVQSCQKASRKIAGLTNAEKNAVLNSIAEQMEKHSQEIITKNKIDMENAEKNDLPDAMKDRLLLNKKRISKMAKAVREIAELDDPVGKIGEYKKRPSGIQVARMSIPLGVIAMIYESRPNVTSDAAALCLKAGNAIVLRGGSEAFHSNQAIANVIHKALEKQGLPKAIVTLIPTTDREAVNQLLQMNQYIDLLIPRGGEGLIRFVDENSRIPVIKHYKGVCHLYVDKYADLNKAMKLLIDGKVSRTGVCNALETLLVHEKNAQDFLSLVSSNEHLEDVLMHGCETTQKIIPEVKAATEDDYYAEYLTKEIAIKVVSSQQEAIDHIHKYGSDHTEVIATENIDRAQDFTKQVNSSVVMVNASSRFSDGGELGLGAEIGISTTKLHAYGPMGVDSLTTKKFIVLGKGSTRHNIV
ncbi:MAG TPA: glutamate-5-semialdehyde dehydrogenase [bacterium]|nr:glutamate-5-semialdehyde dehydrogenase [bacterium]